MGGGKSGGTSTSKVRYAPYIEDRHAPFLDAVIDHRKAVENNSPFATVADLDHDVAYFGVGFVLADFPSLYAQYGTFISGVNVDDLFDSTFGDTVNSTQVRDLVAAEAAQMDDDLITDVLPRYQVGMRDINSVLSSTFVVGKTVLENARGRNLDKFSADLKYKLIPVALERWNRHLEWNKTVVAVYSEIMKLYFSSKMDIEDHNQEIKVKNLLWPFTALEYERAALGALQGATTTTTKTAGSGGAGRAMSGVLGGAAMGGMVGGPPGMVVGGLLGLVGSFI